MAGRWPGCQASQHSCLPAVVLQEQQEQQGNSLLQLLWRLSCWARGPLLLLLAAVNRCGAVLPCCFVLHCTVLPMYRRCRSMMQGKSAPLLSSFKLSYYTLLNLLRRIEGTGEFFPLLSVCVCVCFDVLLAVTFTGLRLEIDAAG